jgi:ribonuclease T1
MLFIVVALAVVALGWWQQRDQPAAADDRAAASQPRRPEPIPASRTAPPPAAPQDSPPAETAEGTLQAIPPAERAAVARTLALIRQGGPFPYDRDGVTFQNREGHLPRRPSGYYREYTVPTPGAKTRGARRVVQGRDGDTWYTADHYRTFVRIDE